MCIFFALFLIVTIRIRNTGYLINGFIFIALFLTGYYNCKFQTNRYSGYMQEGDFRIIAAVTDDLQETNKNYKATVEIKGIYDSVWHDANSLAIIYVPKSMNAECKKGDILYTKAYLRKIEPNGDKYDGYVNYLHQQHIFTSAFVKDSVEIIDSINQHFLPQQANLFADHLDKKLQEYHSPEIYSFLTALLLGNRKRIDKEVKLIFSKAGVVHVLAISGLHVGIIVILAMAVFTYIVPLQSMPLLKTLIVLLIVWLFAFITGLPVSVTRAAIMFSLFIIASLGQRDYNAVNILAVTAFIVLMINPETLFNVGFQLSFSAVLGILHLVPFMKEMYNPKNTVLAYFTDIIYVSFAAQIATLPIVLYYFQNFPLYGIVANIFVIPLCFLIVSFGIFELITSWCHDIIPHSIAWCNDFIIKILFNATEIVAEIPYATISLQFSPKHVMWYTALYFITVALFYYKRFSAAKVKVL